MADPTQLEKTIEARWKTIEPNAAGIERNPQSTIEPPVGPDTKGDRALGVLRALGVDAKSGTPLEIGATLAEGGMGVVRRATQTSLGREVAVKTLRPETRDTAATMRLLREAWVTGALEHPNIVPVYDVAVDAEGSPLVVLKRIEGVEWGELMHDERRLRDELGVEDAREWNLRVLVQVCNAVHFAHSRGVVHRDLKPENVMIGAFGEVYVVDWGIAVSLSDESDGRLPLARDAKDMAGTPAYMAPEMIGGDAPELSERTDVYLLGAILYEIATGLPPHRGNDLHAILSSVILSRPDLPLTVPTELADLCRRAMAPQPSDRVESAEAFKHAVEQHLRHLDSMALADRARRRLDELLEEAREAEGDESGARLYNLFGECRFGFRAALDAWPDNEAALGGLRLAITSLARFELEQRDPKAAATLIAELDEPPAELVRQLKVVQREHRADAQKIEKLRELERDLDVKTGSRTRTFVIVLMGILWTLAPAVGYRLFDSSGASHSMAIGVSLLFLFVAGGLGLWGRESLLKTRLNRHMLGIILLTLSAQALLRVGVMLMGLESFQGLTLHFFLWFTMVSALCILVDKRFLPAAVGYLFGFFVVSAYPELLFPMMSLANFVLTANAVWIWAPMFSLRRGPSE